MWAAEIKRKVTQTWHVSAAVLLHAALGMVIFSYKPSARTVELVTPIDLSLFKIEPSPPAAPVPLSTDEPDQTSEQTDLPTPAPIGSQDVDISPPSRLVAPNEIASGNSPIDRDTALSKPPDSVGRPEIPQGWIIEDNDVWFGVPKPPQQRKQTPCARFLVYDLDAKERVIRAVGPQRTQRSLKGFKLQEVTI